MNKPIFYVTPCIDNIRNHPHLANRLFDVPLDYAKTITVYRFVEILNYAKATKRNITPFLPDLLSDWYDLTGQDASDVQANDVVVYGNTITL